ncbi:putative necrosis-inducing factor-domain-containing protein [Podospora australis]|uniref:Necrosis-inducing factor-domain-containing protein n=1 Tax=Podospora australis TaxID=1536484 RepID=A0AAN6WN56_9PEZI|nr:putative necrosis-inducing factor-domain-containing protein [Podospora australis]
MHFLSFVLAIASFLLATVSGFSAAFHINETSDIWGTTDTGDQFKLGRDLVPGSQVIKFDSNGNPVIWFSNATIASVRVNGTNILVNECTDDGGVYIESTDGSPLSDDCHHMIENIEGAGTWTVSSYPEGQFGKPWQLVQQDSCAYSVKNEDFWTLLYVGNDDIRLAVGTAIDRNNYHDTVTGQKKVGAHGFFKCTSTPGLPWRNAKWWLYHDGAPTNGCGLESCSAQIARNT